MADQLLLRDVRTLGPGEAVLDQLHEALGHFWAYAELHRSTPSAGRWQLEFTTALGEIIGNVVRHAQPGEGIQLDLCLYVDRVQAQILDSGAPFLEPLPGPWAPDDVETLPEGGYGLRIARSVLDSLEYSRVDGRFNRWLLVKGWTSVTPKV